MKVESVDTWENMKGREKCSRSGTVKVTRVTSNLESALKLEQTNKKRNKTTQKQTKMENLLTTA